MKRGRPAKTAETKRTEVLRASATKAEADAVYRAAIKAGMKPGDYMRSRLGLSVANELREC